MVHLMFWNMRPSGCRYGKNNGSQTPLDACEMQDAGVNETLREMDLGLFSSGHNGKHNCVGFAEITHIFAT